MYPLRRPRYRRAVSLCLLASLAVGLASPALAARSGGATSIYEQWLGDRLGERADHRTDLAMEILSGEAFPTLRAYVVSFVRTLVAEEGLDASAGILGEDSPETTRDLSERFLAGLRSLSSDRLPEAALLPGSDGRAVPLERSMVASAVLRDAGLGHAPPVSAPASRVRVLPAPAKHATGGARPRAP